MVVNLKKLAITFLFTFLFNSIFCQTEIENPHYDSSNDSSFTILKSIRTRNKLVVVLKTLPSEKVNSRYGDLIIRDFFSGKEYIGKLVLNKNEVEKDSLVTFSFDTDGHPLEVINLSFNNKYAESRRYAISSEQTIRMLIERRKKELGIKYPGSYYQKKLEAQLEQTINGPYEYLDYRTELVVFHEIHVVKRPNFIPYFDSISKGIFKKNKTVSKKENKVRYKIVNNFKKGKVEKALDILKKRKYNFPSTEEILAENYYILGISEMEKESFLEAIIFFNLADSFYKSVFHQRRFTLLDVKKGNSFDSRFIHIKLGECNYYLSKKESQLDKKMIYLNEATKYLLNSFGYNLIERIGVDYIRIADNTKDKNQKDKFIKKAYENFTKANCDSLILSYSNIFFDLFFRKNASIDKQYDNKGWHTNIKELRYLCSKTSGSKTSKNDCVKVADILMDYFLHDFTSANSKSKYESLLWEEATSIYSMYKMEDRFDDIYNKLTLYYLNRGEMSSVLYYALKIKGDINLSDSSSIKLFDYYLKESKSYKKVLRLIRKVSPENIKLIEEYEKLAVFEKKQNVLNDLRLSSHPEYIDENLSIFDRNDIKDLLMLQGYFGKRKSRIWNRYKNHESVNACWNNTKRNYADPEYFDRCAKAAIDMINPSYSYFRAQYELISEKVDEYNQAYEKLFYLFSFNSPNEAIQEINKFLSTNLEDNKRLILLKKKKEYQELITNLEQSSSFSKIGGNLDLKLIEKVSLKLGDEVLSSYLIKNYSDLGSSVKITSYQSTSEYFLISIGVKLKTKFNPTGLSWNDVNARRIKTTFDIKFYGNGEIEKINVNENGAASGMELTNQMWNESILYAKNTLDNYRKEFAKSMQNLNTVNDSNKETPCYTLIDKSTNPISNTVTYKVRCKDGDVATFHYYPDKGCYSGSNLSSKGSPSDIGLFGLVSSNGTYDKAIYNYCGCK